MVASDRNGVARVIEDESCYYLVGCNGINVLGESLGEATLIARFENLSGTIKVTVVPPT